MSLLPGRLGMKAAEALPGITGAILSWILNKATDVVWLGIPNNKTNDPILNLTPENIIQHSRIE